MICNGLKRTISASGELELLLMVLEPDTEWCANETLACKEMDCEIPHWLESLLGP